MPERSISRRELLQFGSKSALAAVSCSAAGLGPSVIRSIIANSTEVPPSTQTVKDFAPEIIKAGKRLTDLESNDQIVKVVTGMFAGDAALSYAQGMQGASSNRIGGLIAAAGANTIDLISSAAAARQAKDPRFKEYGFDSYTGESNPLMGNNPTSKRLLIKSVLTSAAGYFVPAIGRAYLGASPFISENNYKTVRTLKACFELGDTVKIMLEEGRNPNSIRSFLNLQGMQDK